MSPRASVANGGTGRTAGGDPRSERDAAGRAPGSRGAERARAGRRPDRGRSRVPHLPLARAVRARRGGHLSFWSEQDPDGLESAAATAAAERALEAAEAADSVGDPFDAAHARLVAGVALAQASDERRAGDALELAANAFESFGSQRYRAEAVRELRKLGRRIHRRTKAGTRDAVGIRPLTERELEIARLVTDRRTNAEIAARLFLSQKTIQAHLRNSFTVDSRNRGF
jgi:Bacterial regulatory proteins, luxR family